MNTYAANHIYRVLSKLEFSGSYDIFKNLYYRPIGTYPVCTKEINDEQSSPNVLSLRPGVDEFYRMHKMVWVYELINDIRLKKIIQFDLRFENVYVRCRYVNLNWTVDAILNSDVVENYDGFIISRNPHSFPSNCKRVPVQKKGILNCNKFCIWLNAISAPYS